VNGDLDRLLERMRQRREQRAADLTGVQVPLAPAGVGRGLAHPLGRRVFDTVTGQHGEVIGGTTENIVVSTAQ
jgi:hypothetical protein